MRREENELKLTKAHANKLRKYCRGCRYFKPEKDVKDVCTLVGWYRIDKDIDFIVELVKGCPCYKCLVKASCQEIVCPPWIKYVESKSDQHKRKVFKES